LNSKLILKENMNKNKSTRGIVYLVGAGPGHPGLITRLGYELLQSCDVIVYDDLIPIELIVGLSARIEKYYVGKRVGRHSKPQDETNRLLVELANSGRKVIRLKGGDPMFFSRTGEEAAYLSGEGIECMIVPGVTAASAASAEAGFSLTDRRAASWVLMATGHEARSDSLPVPWQDIGTLKGGTVVVYMGIGELESIIVQMLKGGVDPDTPSCVIQNASTGSLRIVEAPLSKIARESRQNQVEPPALVIIGKVTEYGKSLRASHRQLLSGKRILITRPAQQIGKFCRLLREQGAEPIPYPTIAINPFNDNAGWVAYKKAIPTGGWCVFTSEAGVSHFYEQLFENGLDVRALARFRIAAVGQGTSAALKERGFIADLIPDQARVDRLTDTLVREADLGGVNVIRIRGNRGDDTVEKTTTNKGAKVIPLTVYHNSTAKWEPQWIRNIIESSPDYIAFTSGSTVEGFVEILGEERAREVVEHSRIASIGPMTSAVVHGYGLNEPIEAESYNIKGVVEVIKQDVKRCL